MEDAKSRFDHLTIGLKQMEGMELLREKFKELERYMYEVVPTSREQSLALTKLEEASMWANKGISHSVGDSK